MELPELETLCAECRGHGGDFYELDGGRRGGIYCKTCGGTGYIATELGARIEAFLEHALQRLEFKKTA